MLKTLAAAAAAALALMSVVPAQAEPFPSGWQASNMAPVGYIKLPGPRAFKLSLKQANGRWYLFVAEGGQSGLLPQAGRGFNVVDVTDPTKPKVVATVPIANGAGQLTLHGDLLIVGIHHPPDAGTPTSQEDTFTASKPVMNDLANFYDISDPAHPKLLSTWKAMGWATHRNTYPGGKYAYMATWIAGYRGQAILTVLDVSDPKNPKEVGHWWQAGQRDDEAGRPPPNGYHGPATVSADGKMLTLGYTPSLVNLDITDPTHPKLIGKTDFSPLPLTGAQSIHTGQPTKNGFAIVTIEATPPGCNMDSAPWAAMMDNRDPVHPRLAGYFPRPSPPPGAPYKSFCDKGGRFGPHNVNAEIHLPDAQTPDELVFMTYFTAGIRVYDISDPYVPKETGWFLPPVGTWDSGDRGLEDVLVDTRGYAYVSQGVTGRLWILRYTNPKGPQLPTPALAKR